MENHHQKPPLVEKKIPPQNLLRRICAAIILALLLIVPFFNWQLGALLWLCAWVTFLAGKLFDRKSWKLGQTDDENKDNQ